MLLCLKDSILTGENYKKRGGIDHVACSLCLQDDETTDHLLISCVVTQKFWKETLKSLNIADTWMLSTLEKNLLHSFIKYPRLRCIPFLVSWRIWRYRNKVLFENGQRDESRIITRILLDINEFKDT